MAKSPKVNMGMKGSNITIGIEGLDSVSKALGDLSGKTGQVMKVAVNQTAKRARKLMIAAAKARYAVNSAGARHLSDLEQKRKATNSNPQATLRIQKPKSDLGYFRNVPSTVYTGTNVRWAPEYVQAQILNKSSLFPVRESGNLSKGFLAEFKSGHIGMVQRVIGSKSPNAYTKKSGAPRWRNRRGNVEKLQTVTAPSAAAMHHVIWPEIEDEVRIYLLASIEDRIDWVINHYRSKE